jgi:hypothetical protein
MVLPMINKIPQAEAAIIIPQNLSSTIPKLKIQQEILVNKVGMN